MTLVASRVRVELLHYLRQRDALFFTFLLPPLLLVLFASVFGDVIEGTGVPFSQYFFAGIIGTVGLNVGFGTLAGSVATDRSTRALDHLSSTPMPPWVYVAGKVVVTILSAVVQLALLLAVGWAAFDLDLPDGGGWFTLAWVFALALTAFSLAGVAFSRLIGGTDSINAAVSPVITVLPFISGVYFEFGDLPSWMQAAGSVFPLRWATLGMRSAFLPDSFQLAEPGGSWQLGTVALALVAWCAAGAWLCARTFRWHAGER